MKFVSGQGVGARRGKILGPCKRRGCKTKRRLPPKPQSGVARVHYERDPYCSRDCCEADHGIRARTGIYDREYPSQRGAA